MENIKPGVVFIVEDKKMKISKSLIAPLLIFSLALSLRLVSAVQYNKPLEGDEPEYNELALSVINHGTYQSESPYSRPPLYPFFISAVYLIFGCKFIAVRIAQAVIDSLMCILMYKLCHAIFNRRIALIASFTSAVYMVFIKASCRFLTEPLFTFFLFLTVFYVYKTKESFTYKNMIILGALAAIGVLIKGITLIFLPFLFIIFLAVGYYKPFSIKVIFQKMAVAFAAFFILLSFWAYRNYLIYHAFVPVSTREDMLFMTPIFRGMAKFLE